MLCSSCSQVVKPVVSIDIDGTLGDYHGHLDRFIKMYYGLPVAEREPYDGSMSHREWYEDQLGISAEEFRNVKLAYRAGGQKRSMPVYPDAHKLTSAVRELGAELWICTTRPFLRLDNIDPDTRFWLSKAGIDYDGMLYGDDKYAQLAEQVDSDRIVAVLDDLEEECQKAERLFGDDVPILRKSRYSRRAPIAPHRKSIRSLPGALSSIKNRISAWNNMSV